MNALGGTISQPAWRTKPSWYLLTTDDKMIPPAAQRLMAKRAGATVVEVKASHAIFVSQPRSGREPDREGRQRRAGDGSALAGGVRRIMSTSGYGSVYHDQNR